MKVALLVLLALGFVALSQSLPVEQLMEDDEQAENAVIDPNCDKSADASTGDDTADPDASAVKGKKMSKGKGGKGGKGKGKGGKGKGKGDKEEATTR